MDGVRKKSLKELLPKDEFEPVAPRHSTRKAVPEAIEIERPDLDNEIAPAIPPVRSVLPAAQARPKARPVMVVSLLLILLFGGYYASAVFATATVKITPRLAEASIDGEYSAMRAPSTGIEYSVMKLSDSLEKTIPSTGQKKSDTKARGTVTITNNFSTASQALVAGTRLSTPGGQIYKLDSAVTVPGQSKAGGKIVPGKITVKVTAAEPGPAYNHNRVDLKIVGFKGTAKYDKFAAETAGFSGGFSGMVAVVNEADREKALIEAKKQLEMALAEKARLQIPKGHLLAKEAAKFTFSDELKDSSATSTILKVSADMIAILFEEHSLSEMLAAKYFPDEAIDGVLIEDFSNLNFSVDGTELAAAAKDNEIKFKANGRAKFVWPIETTALIDKLRGSGMGARAQVFSAFPNIHRAEAYIRPPWILSFPEKSDKINVILETKTSSD